MYVYTGCPCQRSQYGTENLPPIFSSPVLRICLPRLGTERCSAEHVWLVTQPKPRNTYTHTDIYIYIYISNVFFVCKWYMGYIYINNNVDVYVSIYLCDISPGKLMPKVVSTPSQTPRSGLGAQGAWLCLKRCWWTSGIEELRSFSFVELIEF